VLLEGRLRLVVDVPGKTLECAGFEGGEGDFVGEVALLLGTPFFASIRAVTSARVARLDRQQFHHLVRDSEEARDMILRTAGERLLRIQERTLSTQASRVFIYGRNKDKDCQEIRSFLSSNRIPYEWVDRDRSPERVPAGLSDDPDCPAVTIDGRLFIEPPTTRQIAD